MGNSLDTDGRGPSESQLLGYGVAVLLVIAVTTTALLLRSTGQFSDYVRVVADLKNVGDGLPAKSDVKYHGMLVGSVDDVDPAAFGKPNYVHIDLKSEYARDIPAAVTARVVPSNVFAVSSVQLIDNGPKDPDAPKIRGGDHIKQDDKLSTVIFQTTISKLRDILTATGRGRGDPSLGILAAVGAATDNKRDELLDAAGQLSRLLDQLNGIVATDAGPSTISALVDATRALKSTAPDLVDALHDAVRPMQTFAEKRAELTSLIGGAQHTLETTRQAFDNHTDQMIQMTHDLTPVLGVFAQNADTFVPIFSRVRKLSDLFFQEVWIPEYDTGNMRVNLSLTPTYTYTRADCPQYGELKGPSCYTAPLVSVRADLPESMLPQNYHFPPGLAPPPGTEVGPDGNLIAVGPPLINPNPNLADPNPPLPWWTGPAPRVPGTADPTDPGPPPVSGPRIPAAPVAPGYGNPAPAGPPLGAEAAPASYGGNVGPVGSPTERVQLGVMTGQPRPASVATQLLLGPVARGMTVSVASEPAEGPK